jgi:hypothetical protein
MKTACGYKRHSSCWYFYQLYGAQFAGCACQKHSVDHCHCLRSDSDVSCIIRPRENTTPILILKTSGNTTVNIFHNLFQLTSLFQRHYTWNNAWTFNKEIHSINECLREALVTFNAANTNRSVRSEICTFHFPNMSLKSEPRIGRGMDCARCIAGYSG